MLKGKFVNLRAIEQGDQRLLNKWRNDPDVYGYLFEHRPQSLSDQCAWWERAREKRDELTLGIDLVCHGEKLTELIGLIGLVDIDMRNRSAYLGRFYIGNERHRGAGYGAEAELLLLDYAFAHLGMNRVYCQVFAFNKSVIKLHERFGFQIEGVMRKAVYRNRKFEDVVSMGLLCDEYYDYYRADVDSIIGCYFYGRRDGK